MKSSKAIAGILMLVMGLLGLFFILIINSGHTSSASSRTDNILGMVVSIVFLVAGGYAVRTRNKN
jgi:hypothetical protein